MIKILVNSYTAGGCGKFRVNDPHQMLQELFKDDVEVTFNNNIKFTGQNRINLKDLFK